MEILQNPYDWFPFSLTPTDDSGPLRRNINRTEKGGDSFRNNKSNKEHTGKIEKAIGIKQLRVRTRKEQLNDIMMESPGVFQSSEGREHQKNSCLKCTSLSTKRTFHRHFQMKTIKSFLVLVIFISSLVQSGSAQESTVGKSLVSYRNELFYISFRLIAYWRSLIVFLESEYRDVIVFTYYTDNFIYMSDIYFNVCIDYKIR